MVSVNQAYMVGHMKNADGSINNKNVVLSAACEAAELFQCMMSVNQKLEDWQRFNHTLELHLRSVECEKIHDICQAVYGMKHPSDELEGLYLAREDEQICLLYYQVFDGKPERVLEIQKYVNEQYECCSNKKFMKVLETIARMNGNEEVYIEDMYACNKEARNYYLSELMMCFNFVFNEMCHGTGSVAGSDFNNEEE